MLEKWSLSNRFARVIGLVLLSVLLAVPMACTPAEEPGSQTADKVRVGYLVSDLHHISHLVAQESAVGGGQSLYDKHGLVIEDAVGAPYENGGVVMDHFATGDIDIGLLGLPPAIIKHLNAATNTSIVAQVNEIGSSLVVAKGVNSLADLVGETVATPSHSSIQFFLLLSIAEKQGLDPSQLTIIDMPVAHMQARLEKGDIGGFIAWEPFPSAALLADAGKVLATSQDIWPNHPDCVVVANREFAQKNPEAVRKFLDAHTAAIQWINDALAKPDSEEYGILLDLGVKFTGRTSEVVKEAFKGIHYRATIDTGFQDNFTRFANKLIEYKIVPNEKLQERGYKSVEDFATSYIQQSIQGTSR